MKDSGENIPSVSPIYHKQGIVPVNISPYLCIIKSEPAKQKRLWQESRNN